MSTIQRITGMNSGLDVDSLVKTSMKAYQTKIDKEVQNQKVLEYQQEQYKKVMSDASAFYDKYCDILKEGNLRLTSSYNTVTFTSGDPTKVTAKGFAGADAAGYTVSVESLATSANATITTDKLVAGKKISVTMGSLITDQITIDSDNDKTATLLTQALQAKGINATAKYSQFAGGIIIEAGDKGTGHAFSVTEFDSDGISNPVTTTATDGTNLRGVVTKGAKTVNLSGTSNTVTIDNVQFTLKAASTATTAADLPALTDTDVTNENATKTKSGGTTTYTSTDGKTVTVDDGTTITTTQVAADGSLTKTVTNGGTKTTNKYAAVSLSGSTDVSGLKDKIVSFINDYNTLIQSIDTKLWEKRDKSYMPLTDDQKKEMTDTQVEAWETKAKTGLLRGDSDLQRIKDAMKSAMSTVMSGSGEYLDKIGIKPIKNYAEKDGILVVDEGKLTTALQDNAAAVKDLFSRSASKDGTDKGGIITQLEAVLKSEFKQSDSALSKKAGLDGTSTEYTNTLTQYINDKKTLIAQMNQKYTDQESALYKKYSALETAMQKLNSQQTQLSSMLGQG